MRRPYVPPVALLLINASLLVICLVAALASWWAPLVFRPPAALPPCRNGMSLAPGASCTIILRIPLPSGPAAVDEHRDHA